MKTPEPEDGSTKFYTQAEVAKMFRVSPGKVAEWIESGELVAFNVGQGKIKPRYRIEQAAIEAFKQKRASVRPQPEPEPQPYKRIALGPRPGEK